MILLYLFIAALAFLLLFLTLSKFTKNLDENEDFLNPTLAYQDFCEAVASELMIIMQLLRDEKLQASNKEACLDQLDNFKRQILYTKNINLSKDKATWQDSLTKFLLKVDEYIELNFVNGDKVADLLRTNLADKFKKL